MDKYVILHNPHDKVSREFVLANPGYQVIEFYTQEQSNHFIEYCTKELPMPSIFPCLVDTELGLKEDAVEDIEAAKAAISYKKDFKIRSLAFDAKNKRRDLFTTTSWIRERHQDQLSSGMPTSLTAEQYQAWLEYWQALRDMDFSDVENIVFPQQPAL